jgi:hypothetical protein
LADISLLCSQLETFYDFVAGNLNPNTVDFYGYTQVPVWTRLFKRFYDYPLCLAPPQGVSGPPDFFAWAFVSDFGHMGPLQDRIWDLVEKHTERDTWFILLTLLFEIGTAIRTAHAVAGPHRYVLRAFLFTPHHTISSPPPPSQTHPIPNPY